MRQVTKTLLTLKVVLLSVVFGVSAGMAASPEEREAWNAARMLGTQEAYQAFLEAFPTSAYADQAFSSMISALSSPAGGGTGAAGSPGGGAGSGSGSGGGY